MSLMALMRDMDEEQKVPSRPVLEAQEMELKARFALYNEKNKLQIGDLVEEKQGCGVVRKESQDTIAFMLWRWLDSDDWQDRAIMEDHIHRHHVSRLDCVVAYVTDDGFGLQFLPHDSNALRKR